MRRIKSTIITATLISLSGCYSANYYAKSSNHYNIYVNNYSPRVTVRHYGNPSYSVYVNNYSSGVTIRNYRDGYRLHLKGYKDGYISIGIDFDSN